MLVRDFDFTKCKRRVYKYQLEREVNTHLGVFYRAFTSKYISLSNDGLLTQSIDYRWDGCSGPTWDNETATWWHGSTMQGGCCHDGGYQALREGWMIPEGLDEKEYYKDFCMLRFAIDTMFHTQLLADGFSSFRAGYYYYGVRKFGEKHALPERLK